MRNVPRFAGTHTDEGACHQSQGDLVPRIQRRWYYRYLRYMQAAAGLVSSKANFAPVGHDWTFEAEPPTSLRDLEHAVQQFRSGLEAAVKKAEEEKRKRELENEANNSQAEPGAQTAG